jgi:hypothetical protein
MLEDRAQPRGDACIGARPEGSAGAASFQEDCLDDVRGIQLRAELRAEAVFGERTQELLEALEILGLVSRGRAHVASDPGR